MTEHTRGPWHVVLNPDEIGANWMVCSNGDYVIETEGLHSDELGDSLADAHLLAAAPAMLHALMAALVPAGDTPEQVRAEMLAAVKMATGEPSGARGAPGTGGGQ